MSRHVLNILILTFYFTLVKCHVPDLSVQTLDKRLIERKRQDTLDMCRLFTAETEKLNSLSDRQQLGKREKKRYKRETGAQRANDEVENARRIESIVDKLYDDMEEKGKQVPYRRRDLDSLTTASYKDTKNLTMRRFNFAPAELLGPLPTAQPSTGYSDVGGTAGGIDWPKRWKHGIVPYYIDSKTYDADLADEIIKAFDYFEKETCIRLQKLKDRPTDSESLQKVEWLYISNPSGIRQCVHSNERKVNKGVQLVVFGYDCMTLGEIVHEVMHILGFSHEHTRPDRDQFISILWNNIKPGYKKYFEARTYDPLLNVPYDYGSVLHYPPRAFSKNGQVTVMAKPGIRLGQRDGLSDGDVEKVGLVYGNECVDRNRQYLLKTCPSVVKVDPTPKKVSKDEIMDYYRDRLWLYGVVNYKLRDSLEFSTEEKENIKAVIRHIEKETCIEFRNISEDEENDDDDKDDNAKSVHFNRQDKENDEVENGVSLGNNDNTIPSDASQQGEAENEIIPTVDAVTSDINQPELRKGSETTTAATTPHQIKTRRRVGFAQRRHATDVLELARSVEPGCACPNPGRPKGSKVIYINADCFNSVNDLLHLFVHLLGLEHQHNMHDRDSYLHILWENLTPEIREEMKNKLPPAAAMGFPYDYQSVMHYPWLQIKNGVTNVMYPIWNDGWAMGHWQGLSSTDVFKLNFIYYEQCFVRIKEQQNHKINSSNIEFPMQKLFWNNFHQKYE